MKLLSDILYGVRLQEVSGTMNIAVDALHFDSRAIKKHSLFVAVKGTQSNGHDYIDKAIASGALAIVCEELPEIILDEITYVKVNDSAEALGIIASNFYDNPSEKLKLIGVTGTNGKTTTVTLLFNLFRQLGFKTGMLSTVVNRINNEIIPSTHTTPNQIELNRMLNEMVEMGCTYCFMEVSSHAVHQKRIAGVKFSSAVFTNLTHDHLDYHGTFDEYIKAKKGFFDKLDENANAIVNKDDYHSDVMVQNTKAKVITYGLKSLADIKCKVIENHFGGLLLNINNREVWTKLVGTFNAYNITAAYAVAKQYVHDEMALLTAISTLNPAEGRFQYLVSENDIKAIVDYAHTPDALKNVLSTIKDIRTGNEKVITVVGCGGDRDKAKRPLMAGIAAEMSNKVVLTSDNPRSEDPETIIKEMWTGVPRQLVKNVLSITDRKEAIRTAFALAEPGDIILIAGKGHEKYQEIKGVKHPFDDMEIINEIFKTNN